MQAYKMLPWWYWWRSLQGVWRVLCHLYKTECFSFMSRHIKDRFHYFILFLRSYSPTKVAFVWMLNVNHITSFFYRVILSFLYSAFYVLYYLDHVLNNSFLYSFYYNIFASNSNYYIFAVWKRTEYSFISQRQ